MAEDQAIVYGSVFDRSFSDTMLSAIVRRRKFKTDGGELQGGHTKSFRKDWSRTRSNLEPFRMQVEHPNSFIRYGEDFVLKLYRRLEAGINPDREMLEFLTEKTAFWNTPRALGWLEYRQGYQDNEIKTTIGLLTSFTRNGIEWVAVHARPSWFVLRACAGDSSRKIRV